MNVKCIFFGIIFMLFPFFGFANVFHCSPTQAASFFNRSSSGFSNSLVAEKIDDLAKDKKIFSILMIETCELKNAILAFHGTYKKVLTGEGLSEVDATLDFEALAETNNLLIQELSEVLDILGVGYAIEPYHYEGLDHNSLHNRLIFDQISTDKESLPFQSLMELLDVDGFEAVRIIFDPFSLRVTWTNALFYEREIFLSTMSIMDLFPDPLTGRDRVEGFLYPSDTFEHEYVHALLDARRKEKKRDPFLAGISPAAGYLNMGIYSEFVWLEEGIAWMKQLSAQAQQFERARRLFDGDPSGHELGSAILSTAIVNTDYYTKSSETGEIKNLLLNAENVLENRVIPLYQPLITSFDDQSASFSVHRDEEGYPVLFLYSPSLNETQVRVHGHALRDTGVRSLLVEIDNRNSTIFSEANEICYSYLVVTEDLSPVWSELNSLTDESSSESVHRLAKRILTEAALTSAQLHEEYLELNRITSNIQSHVAVLREAIEISDRESFHFENLKRSFHQLDQNFQRLGL